jgi:hypothetical protein
MIYMFQEKFSLLLMHRRMMFIILQNVFFKITVSQCAVTVE